MQMKMTCLTEHKFIDFGLHYDIIKGLEEKEFHNCIPVQALALSILLIGRNIVEEISTGVEKIMAFITATFHCLLTTEVPANRMINCSRAIIMAPTRALAIQIYNDTVFIASFNHAKGRFNLWW